VLEDFELSEAEQALLLAACRISDTPGRVAG
jgi:hypothetical protein